MRISDWSSDVCSSDLPLLFDVGTIPFPHEGHEQDALDALDAACRAKETGHAPAAFIVEPLILAAGGMLRSDERRVGKECVSTCSSRWSPDPSQNHTHTTHPPTPPTDPPPPHPP